MMAKKEGLLGLIRPLNLIFMRFAVLDVGLSCCSFSLLENPERENSPKIKKTVLFLFIFGLLSFIFGMLG
jgi:hypothetical protein